MRLSDLTGEQAAALLAAQPRRSGNKSLWQRALMRQVTSVYDDVHILAELKDHLGCNLPFSGNETLRQSALMRHLKPGSKTMNNRKGDDVLLAICLQAAMARVKMCIHKQHTNGICSWTSCCGHCAHGCCRVAGCFQPPAKKRHDADHANLLHRSWR